MTPRATFVIPAYNSDLWISKTLWSCRNQIIKQIEIIVVNDGSTDGTRDILDWHAKEDKRIRVFHRENQGRSAARNFGNEQAESDLILVLDSDDLATRNRVKDTLAFIELKKPDFMYGSFFEIDAHGNTIRKLISSPFDPVVSKENRLNYICHSTVAYTKKLSESVKYDEGTYSTLGLDDWKFQWEVHKKGFSIKNIKNPMCYYRNREEGTMSTRDPKQAKTEYFASVQ